MTPFSPRRILAILTLCSAALFVMTTSRAAEPMGLALMSFAPSEPALSTVSAQTRELLTQHLSKLPGITVVDHAKLDRLMAEHGIKPTDTSNLIRQAGGLADAKIVISGQILESGGIAYLIAKVNAVETARVFVAMTTHPTFAELEAQTVELADKIAGILKKNAAVFAATAPTETR